MELRATDGVTETEHLLLPDEVDVRKVRDATDDLEFADLALCLEFPLELAAAVEMLLNGALAAPDDDEE